MFTFGATDHREVRRFRIAQFNGRTVTVSSGGSTITVTFDRYWKASQAFRNGGPSRSSQPNLN
jgi:hypothetical protein